MAATRANVRVTGSADLLRAWRCEHCNRGFDDLEGEATAWDDLPVVGVHLCPVFNAFDDRCPIVAAVGDSKSPVSDEKDLRSNVRSQLRQQAARRAGMQAAAAADVESFRRLGHEDLTNMANAAQVCADPRFEEAMYEAFNECVRGITPDELRMRASDLTNRQRMTAVRLRRLQERAAALSSLISMIKPRDPQQGNILATKRLALRAVRGRELDTREESDRLQVQAVIYRAFLSLVQPLRERWPSDELRAIQSTRRAGLVQRLGENILAAYDNFKTDPSHPLADSVSLLDQVYEQERHEEEMRRQMGAAASFGIDWVPQSGSGAKALENMYAALEVEEDVPEFVAQGNALSGCVQTVVVSAAKEAIVDAVQTPVSEAQVDGLKKFMKLDPISEEKEPVIDEPMTLFDRLAAFVSRCWQFLQGHWALLLESVQKRFQQLKQWFDDHVRAKHVVGAISCVIALVVGAWLLYDRFTVGKYQEFWPMWRSQAGQQDVLPVLAAFVKRMSGVTAIAAAFVGGLSLLSDIGGIAKDVFVTANAALSASRAAAVGVAPSKSQRWEHVDLNSLEGTLDVSNIDLVTNERMMKAGKCDVVEHNWMTNHNCPLCRRMAAHSEESPSGFPWAELCSVGGSILAAWTIWRLWKHQQFVESIRAIHRREGFVPQAGSYNPQGFMSKWALDRYHSLTKSGLRRFKVFWVSGGGSDCNKEVDARELAYMIDMRYNITDADSLDHPDWDYNDWVRGEIDKGLPKKKADPALEAAEEDLAISRYEGAVTMEEEAGLDRAARYVAKAGKNRHGQPKAQARPVEPKKKLPPCDDEKCLLRNLSKGAMKKALKAHPDLAKHSKERFHRWGATEWEAQAMSADDVKKRKYFLLGEGPAPDGLTQSRTFICEAFYIKGRFLFPKHALADDPKWLCGPAAGGSGNELMRFPFSDFTIKVHQTETIDLASAEPRVQLAIPPNWFGNMNVVPPPNQGSHVMLFFKKNVGLMQVARVYPTYVQHQMQGHIFTDFGDCGGPYWDDVKGGVYAIHCYGHGAKTLGVVIPPPGTWEAVFVPRDPELAQSHKVLCERYVRQLFQ